MGLQLKTVTDPRDKLERVRRKSLENFIRAYHPDLYEHNMPATIMRALLRAKRIYDINAPVHSFSPPPQQDVPAVNAEDLAMAEWKARKKAKMSMPELRKAVKAKGLVAPRTARYGDLVNMLNGG